MMKEVEAIGHVLWLSSLSEVPALALSLFDLSLILIASPLAIVWTLELNP